MQIVRLFTHTGEDVFSRFEYESCDCSIMDHRTGKPSFEFKGAEVPKHWSKNARDVLVSKYFRKGGVPVETLRQSQAGLPGWLAPAEAVGLPTTTERSVKQVVHRLAGHWTFVGFRNGYFEPTPEQFAAAGMRETEDNRAALQDDNARAFYDEMAYMLLAQIAAPNSPQWFNTGLSWAYGITGPKQGHYFVDLPANTKYGLSASDAERTGIAHKLPIDPPNLATCSPNEARDLLAPFTKQSNDAYTRVQGHACFILEVQDNLLSGNGIIPWVEREARIFKYGSGSGANLSKLRGTDEPLSGGGKSSGLMSWIETGDRSAGAIKSGGTTRRAAKMVCVDLDHPDIEKFINCKVEAEVSVASMVIGSRLIKKHCQTIIDAVSSYGHRTLQEAIANASINDLVVEAQADGVLDNYIHKAILLGTQDVAEWPDSEFNSSFNGRAYEIAPYQNANHSVRMPTSFYLAVDKDRNWQLTARTNGTVVRTLKAREIEHAIAAAAWFCGDPGVQYDTIINDWNVTPGDGTIDASNPCSEHMRHNGSACNLASINLIRFLNSNATGRVTFDCVRFRHAIHLWQITLDITNTMAHLPDFSTAQGVYLYRDTGLGYTSLGALLMSLGIAYDSPEALAFAGMVTAFLQGQANLTSAIMAHELGAYPRFWANKQDHLRCMRNHREAAKGTGHFEELTVPPLCIDHDRLREMLGNQYVEIVPDLYRLWDMVVEYGEMYGFRNAETTVIAPAGTIGILLDCDTTGVEPLFGLITHKELVGGGSMRFTAQSVENALHALGYDEVDIRRISENMAQTGTLDGVESQDRRVFQTALSHESDLVLPWQAHIRMMAAVQSFISGAIAKTVNMPSTATIDEIKDAYRMGHDWGCKAIALYRDGSKLSQPLTIAAARKSPVDSSDIEIKIVSPDPISNRVRLGWYRQPGIDVAVEFGFGGKFYLRTTRYDDGKTAEIWATFSGSTGTVQDMLGSLCKTANVALQTGVPLEWICESWLSANFEPSGLVGSHPNIKSATSIPNLMARLLQFHELGETSNLNIQPVTNPIPRAVRGAIETITQSPPYVANVQITGEKCPECGKALVQSGAGCKKCPSCGYAGGCG